MARQIITTANAPSSPLPFESTGRARRRDPRGTVRPSEYNRTIATYCPQKTEAGLFDQQAPWAGPFNADFKSTSSVCLASVRSLAPEPRAS